MTHDHRNLDGLSAAQLDLLVKKLRRKKSPSAPSSAQLVAQPRQDGSSFPLSTGQERLWFLEQLDPGTATYNIAVAFDLEGALDRRALARSIEDLEARHEVLRTTFRTDAAGEPRQSPRPEPGPGLIEEDLCDLPPGEGRREAHRRAAREARRPFDLGRGPMLRARLLSHGETEHTLVLVVHHIAGDGWSAAILLQELGALYRTHRQGQPPTLPDLAIQYADFAVWQRQQLAQGALGPQLDYWRRQLAGSEPVLDLPVDRPRSPTRTSRGARRQVSVPRPVSTALQALAQDQRTTPFIVLLTAWGAFLHRYTFQTDIAIASPVASRRRSQLEGLIGFFANTLVLRLRLDGDPRFVEQLDRSRQTVAEAMAHQDLPFEHLVRELDPQRRLGHAPLAQVMLTLETAPSRLALDELEVRQIELDTGTAKLDLLLDLRSVGDGLEGTLEYSLDLFDAATVERMITHTGILLAGIAERPDARLSELPLLSPGERRTVLEAWNDTGTGAADAVTLHQLFAEQVARTPEAVALVGAQGDLSYRELDRRASRIGRRLRELGAGPEVRVGVMMRRSADLVAALLGVLECGAAYVPIDPAYPRQRIDFMLEDAGVGLVITSPAAPPPARRGPRWHPIDELLAAAEEARPGQAPAAPVRGSADALAYVIYTSGSTGRPKGVAISHRGAVALVAWSASVFPPADLAGVLAGTSISFDLSIFELFVPLARGGCVVLAPSVLALDELPAASRVTLINTVPSAITELVRLEAVPAGVRTVNLAGEALSGDLVREIYARTAVERVLNLYGPSEDTTYSTFCRIGPRDTGAPPIGRPLANTRAYVLDPRARLLPPGLTGELHLGGDNLARGYLDRPATTASRFLPDPYHPEPGRRMYRTGDAVWQGPDGELAFVGRLDHQVKVRGFRIELGEVEAALRDHPAVREAVALVPGGGGGGGGGGDGGGSRLVAFVTLTAGATTDSTTADPAPESSELRRHLAAFLPEHMVPDTVVILDAMPLTPNRKIDRRALLEAPRERSQPSAPEAAPRTATEELIAGLWAKLLGVERVGVNDSFFARGGHSLLAARGVARLRATFEIELPLRRLFEAPTVAGLAAVVDAARSARRRHPAPPLRPAAATADPPPLSFEQERIWFLEQVAAPSAVYNLPAALRLEGRLDLPALTAGLEEILRRHEALRTHFRSRDGQPIQVISPPAPFHLPLLDLSCLAGPPRSTARTAALRWLAERPFDLARGPLHRLAVLRLAGDRHLLVIVVHHLVADGWSTGILVDELAARYQAGVQGMASPLPELPVQYADYARWQRGWLAGDALSERLAAWRERLAELPGGLEWPADRPRPAVQSQRGGHLTFHWPAELGQGLDRLGQSHAATLFMTCFTAYLALLMRFCGQRDIPIATPVANRERREVEGLIGFFANLLVLRVRALGDPSFAELLGEVRQVALDAFCQQELPLAKLVEELRPERDLGQSPLFQTVFALRSRVAPPVLPGLRAELEEVVTATAKFDLTLFLEPTPDGSRGLLEYSLDLFDPTTMERLIDRFRCLVEGVIADPGQRLSALALLSRRQRHQLLDEWNDTAVSGAAEVPVHELVVRQAAAAPDRTAVVTDGATLSYGELVRRAHRLAGALIRRGVGPEVPVGVLLERGPSWVTALLAVLTARGAYIAIDPGYPEERVGRMLDLAGAPILLTASALARPAYGAGREVVLLDRARPWQEDGPETLQSPQSPAELAYVIFTSGSTGEPKGVALAHAGLTNLVAWHRRTYAVGPGDRASHLAGLGFDASVWELWPYLAAGASLHTPPAEVAISPEALTAWLARRRITLSFLATPLAEAVVDREEVASLALRTLLTGGDRLRLAPDALPFTFVNHYGPTESTVVTTAGRVAPGRLPPPIGRAIDNLRALVLDRRLEPVPRGVAGELHVAGRGLARGYVRRPAATAERFLPDPFSAAGERLYRTGDRVRHRPGGELDFLGRADFQVKVRGFRIELGEIEAALLQHPGVREAAVTCPEVAGRRQLVAYTVGEPEERELRELLGRSLPAYMVPSRFVRPPSLPHTASGKIDRGRLPAPEAEAKPAVHVAPRTPAERLLVELCSELLGVGEVGIHDDFFHLGGHSLLAAQIVARLRSQAGVELPLREIFESPVLTDLAAKLEPLLAAGAPDSSPIATGEPAHEAPLSYAQERIWFLDRLQPGDPAYNIPTAVRLTGVLDPATLAASLQRVVGRHESLRTAFPVRDGAPVRQVDGAPRVPLPCIDLSRLDAAARRAARARLADAAARDSFDLARPPLLRARLVRLARHDHVLYLTLHHIIADGWSIRVLMRDLGHFYAAAGAPAAGVPAAGVPAAGAPAALPELPIREADHARWQRRWLEGSGPQASLDYWRRQLAGELPGLTLPTDRPRSSRPHRRPGHHVLHLERRLSSAIDELGRREGATLFMVLLAAFEVLIHRLSGQDDLVVGTPVAGRDRQETEELIGIFLNSLALRTDLSGNPAFRTLLERVKQTTTNAYQHQGVPFEKVLEELVPDRDPSRTPLFQVFFNMLSFEAEAIQLPQIAIEEEPVPDVAAKFDLTVYARSTAHGIRCDWVYDAELFDPRRIEEMAAQYRCLLAQIVEQPDTAIGALSLVTGAGQLPDPGALLEARWQGSVAERFLTAARRAPDKVALVDRHGARSYRQLELESGRVAAQLRDAGLRRGDLVAIYAHRCAELVTGLLGIVRAGAAFLILDPAFPAAALRDRLEIAQPRAWIALAAAGPPDPDLAAWLDRLPPQRRRVLGATPEPAPEPPAAAADAPIEADDLAYVAFTSGTAGRPRGIAGDHRPLSHFLAWHAGRFGLAAGDRFSLLSGLAHDPLLRDVFTPLWSGATLVVPEPEVFSEPGRLAAWMASQQISVAHLTPAVGQLLATNTAGTGAALGALRWAFFGGDRLTGRDIELLRQRAPRVRVVNFYGTTETPQAMAFQELGEPPPVTVPLGHGIDGVQLLVLRRGSAETAGVGELGEIGVRTPYLSRGYLDDPAANRERFVTNPRTGVADDRIYRTGDLGRYRFDGTVDFAGRADLQVSIRGFRIELGEIAGVLEGCPSVRAAAVVATAVTTTAEPAVDGGEPALVACVVPADREAADPEVWRDTLREALPPYMVPARFLILDELPATPNGKVDRAALARRAGADPGTLTPRRPHVAPRDAEEEALARIWRGVLGVERAGVHDNFFELGGHSLLAIRLLARIHEELGFEISLRSLFETPTVAGLAARWRRGGDRATALPALVPDPAARHEPFPLTDIQEAYWVGRTGSLELGQVASHRYLEIDSRELDLDRFAVAWRRLIERHDALRLVMLPDGGQRILAEVPPYEIAVTDLRRLDGVAAGRKLAAIRDRMSHQILAAERWPLFEICAAHLGDGRLRLFFSFDFLIADAWSFSILLRELAAVYRDPAAALPELELSFRDYVLAERALRGTQLYRRCEDYWTARLEELPPGPQLPTAGDPGRLERQRFVRRSGELEAELWARLKARGREAALTPSGVLLAAYAEILATWSRSSAFSLVLTLFQRLGFHPQVGEILGDFTSTTLLTVEPFAGGASESFLDRARRLQERLWSDLDHRYLSGVEVGRALARRTGQAPRSRSQVVFTSTLGLADDGDRDRDGDRDEMLPGEAVYSVSQTPQILLDHQVTERHGRLVFNWDAVEEAFPPNLVEAMFQAYVRLLHGLAGDRQLWRARSVVALGAEETAARERANATAAPLPSGLLHQGFFERASRQPDLPAVISARRSLTYRELAEHAEDLARRLRHQGARPETLVAVFADKGWEQVVAVLAVLRAGAAYLPVDVALPPERIHWLLERGRVEIVLTPAGREVPPGWPAGMRVIEIGDEVEAGEPAPPTGALPELPGQPEELAYVMFTSGSTGVPKGVMIEHRGAVNTCADVNRRFDVGDRDRVLALSALNFDLSVYDVFGLLAAGGAVVMPEPSAMREPDRWIELVERYEVTVWNTVPALVEMLVETLEGRRRPWPAALRLVLMSGDWIPVTLPRRIAELAGHEGAVKIISLGGATEASIWSILHPIDRVDPAWASIPYGRPMVNQRFQVLDPRHDPCPTWVPGDLYIAGVGLARGYWRDPEITAASFLDPPDGGERLYRTGDLGRYLPNGDIEFLGREDFQVKIRGHRIELGEIEANLGQHEAVRSAVAAVIGAAVIGEAVIGAGREHRLAAWVVPEDGRAVEPETLLEFLRGRLPAYMVPAVIVKLDALPLSANGKVDRGALPQPEEAVRVAAAVDLRDPVEEIVAGIWQEVLEVEPVTASSDFFELGGQSVLATRVVARVREALARELPLSALFENPRLSDFAAQLRGTGGPGVRGPLQRAPRDREIPLSFAQQRQWLTAQLEPESPVYNVARGVRFRGMLDVAALRAAIQEILRRHETLRAAFPASETGLPRQVIHAHLEIGAPLVDLSALPEAVRQRETQRLHNEEARRLFDLARGPLIRALLIRWHATLHDGLVTSHHIVSDEWSANLMLQEMSLLYSAAVAGEPSPLPEPRFQYVDYAHTQRQEMSGAALEEKLDYWRRVLAGAPAALELETDHPRQRPRFRGGQVYADLEAEATASLEALSRQQGATLFTTLLAIFKVVLHHHSNQDDIIVGVPIASRDRVELEGMLGYFIDALALRTSLAGNPTFRELLARVRTTVLGAHANQDVPFDKLVEELRPRRLPYRPPYFQVTLNFYNGPMPRFEAPGLEAELLQMYRAVSQYDLTLYLRQRAGELVGGLEYDTDLFKESTARRMWRELELVLREVVTDPDLRLGDLRKKLRKERKGTSMKEKPTRKSRLGGLRKTQRKALALDGLANIETSTFAEDSPLPLVIRPKIEDIDLVTWGVEQRDFLEEKLLTHGGILLRGFDVPSVERFYEIVRALCPDLVNYFEGSSPRISLGDNVYTSTEYPPELFVSLHNELSYAHKWPRKIFFYSDIPALEGGETPIADSRKIYQLLSPELRRRYEEKGVRYVRNLHGSRGAGLSWQTVFETDDRAQVESYCEEGRIDYRWKEDGSLWTQQDRPAVLQHPMTGEKLWFSQAHQFHPSNLGEQEAAALLATAGEENLPINAYFGDGTPLDAAELAEVRTAYDRAMVKFPWQKGDVMILDNMLASHGRMPYKGQRRTVVAMGETVRLADLPEGNRESGLVLEPSA